jgi:hypothetical protein
MTELEKMRLEAITTIAFNEALPSATCHVYGGRRYRVRTVTITVAEMDTAGAGWMVLPKPLTDQLEDSIANGTTVVTVC